MPGFPTADSCENGGVGSNPNNADELVARLGGVAEQRRRLALAERLREAFGENAYEWLHADSRYLGGSKPIEALRAGRVDRVEAALEALDSGFFL